MMNRHGRILAALLCALALISIFVSSAYVVHEAAHPHDCVGADCPICQFIAQVEQHRRGFGMALLALLLFCLVVAVRSEADSRDAADVPARCTLVGRKIRLNN